MNRQEKINLIACPIWITTALLSILSDHPIMGFFQLAIGFVYMYLALREDKK